MDATHGLAAILRDARKSALLRMRSEISSQRQERCECLAGSHKSLRPKTLRRTSDRSAAARCHFHHCKAALVGAVGAETKQAVDAGKAGGIGQHLRLKPLRPLRSLH